MIIAYRMRKNAAENSRFAAYLQLKKEGCKFMKILHPCNLGTALRKMSLTFESRCGKIYVTKIADLTQKREV